MQPALLRLCSPLACRAARQARSVPSCLCNTTAVRLHQAISTTAAATTGRTRHRGPTSRTSSPTPASDSAPAAKVTGPKQARIQIDLELEDVTSDELARTGLQSMLQASSRHAVEAGLLQEIVSFGRRPYAGLATLTVILCSDDSIQQVNAKWRGKNAPTDVLSFPQGAPVPGCPIRLLGDLYISLPTAERQAAERGHSVLDEVRILLVHGVLHLLGFDHETGPADAAAMAQAEASVLKHLQWQGSGLIAANHGLPPEQGDAASDQRGQSQPSKTDLASTTSAHRSSQWSSSLAHRISSVMPAAPDSRQGPEDRASSGSQASTSSPSASQPEPSKRSGAGLTSISRPDVRAELPLDRRRSKPKAGDIKLLALDMDGTLLNSKSQVLPSSAEALRAVAAKGITLCLATGKARPGAVRAMDAAGLAGKGLVVSMDGPGLFLQGLAVYGPTGTLLPGKQLSQKVVEEAFKYAQETKTPLCAFLGDDCVTLHMTDELLELHEVYWEPKAAVLPSLEALLEGPPVKKLLFMTDAARVSATTRPYWEEYGRGLGAEVMQAVPSMLELVPPGGDKWAGLQQLVQHLGISTHQVMACGDGGNDLTLVANVGLGVAMGNAVPQVKEAAKLVVASNDDDGIAEAIERLLL